MSNPRVGVGVIINKDCKILLMARKNSHGEGTWCFPGGHLEFNEEIEDCVNREVMEETGLMVKNIRFAGITNDMFKEERKHYITIFMECDYNSGSAEIKEPDKCTDLGWFSWEDLPEPLFLPISNLLKNNSNYTSD